MYLENVGHVLFDNLGRHNEQVRNLVLVIKLVSNGDCGVLNKFVIMLREENC